MEGVMMRSEKYLSIAVRRGDGKIALRRDAILPWTKRSRFLRLPLIRGGAILIESLVHGIRALSWSADRAIEDIDGEPRPAAGRENSWKYKVWTFGMLVFGLGAGLFLFFWVPLVLTGWTGVESGFAFNIIDGGFRLLIFGLYILLISMWKEIRRFFQYHGAEHKSIYALENDCPLTVDGAAGFSTLHPRCGTSFLLVVMIVSILVFIFLGKPDALSDRFIRLLFVPVIGGISYEFIRFSSRHRESRIARIFILPGLWLQKVTTKEPAPEQLEIGLISLRSALGELLGNGNIVHYDKSGVVDAASAGAAEDSGESTVAVQNQNRV